MGIADNWAEPLRLAGEIAEASTWRQQLADAVRTAGEVRLVTVWTCPPAQPLEGNGATSPRALHASIEAVRRQVLPHVERTAEGATQQRGRLTSTPYLPLENTRHRNLARRALAGFAPGGVEALAFSWMLDRAGHPLGYIGVGDGCTGRHLLARIGAPLQTISERAGRTLSQVLALARGLGAVPPPPPTPGVEPALLTPREREVAQLVAEGCTDAIVSQRLGMSEHTVGVHLRRIFQKLDVHTRTELSSRGVLALPEGAPSHLPVSLPGRRKR